MGWLKIMIFRVSDLLHRIAQKEQTQPERKEETNFQKLLSR